MNEVVCGDMYSIVLIDYTVCAEEEWECAGKDDLWVKDRKPRGVRLRICEARCG